MKCYKWVKNDWDFWLEWLWEGDFVIWERTENPTTTFISELALKFHFGTGGRTKSRCWNLDKFVKDIFGTFRWKCLLGNRIYRSGVQGWVYGQDGFMDKSPERLHHVRKGLKIKIWRKLIFKGKMKEEKWSKIDFIRMVREVEMKHKK